MKTVYVLTEQGHRDLASLFSKIAPFELLCQPGVFIMLFDLANESKNEEKNYIDISETLSIPIYSEWFKKETMED